MAAVDEEREGSGLAEVEVESGVVAGGHGGSAGMHGFAVDAVLDVGTEVGVGGGPGGRSADSEAQAQGAQKARRTLKSRHDYSPRAGMDMSMPE